MVSINALRSYLNGLPSDYQLHWYKIDQVIGQGAFGITYLAEDVNLDRKVAIKEYMPAQLAIRAEDHSAQPVSKEEAEKYFWGRDRFLNEARLLADVEHSSVVQVLSVFETNNTAYMVMQYERGESLDNILRRHGTLDQSQLLEVLYPIMEGLDYIHSRNIIHRDVKPSNIYIREEGPPVLLDFGSARRSLQTRTAQLTSLVTPGYAPIEQYGERANKQGPWTDIYGLGATLHRCITGSPPPDAINRSESIATESHDTYCPTQTITEHEFCPALMLAIENALAFKPQDRPQSINEWRASFEGELRAATETTKSLFTVNALTENFTDGEATTNAPHSLHTYANPYERIRNISRAWLATMGIIAIGITAAYFSGVFTSEGPEDLDYASLTTPSQTFNQAFGDFFRASLSDDTLSIGPLADLEPAIELDIAIPEPNLTALLDSEVPTNGSSLNPPAAIIQATELPASTLKELLDAAERDLLAQRLTRPAGDNALEKYRAALLLDPQNTKAKQGLDQIVESYRKLVDRALAKDDFGAAEKLIDRAKGISVNHEVIADAENALDIAQFDYAIDNLTPPATRTPERSTPNLASIEKPAHDSQKRAERFVQQISGDSSQ